MGSGVRKRARCPVFIFDFGGVVIKWKNNNPIFDSIARRYRIPRSEMRRVLERGLQRLESGEVTIDGLLEESLGKFGKSLREGDSPEKLWTEPFERLVKFRIGTVELVESLRKKGYRVYLFSNTSLPHVNLLRRKRWDKLFDGFLSSCELGSMKPSATAFARALEKIKASPSEVAFVDDRAENVRGAKEFGIRWAFRFTTLPRLRKDIALATSLPARNE